MTPIRVLVIEDDEDDFILAEDLLNEAFGRSVKLDWVKTWDRAMATIQEGGHDICLVDYRLGERTGLELVREAVARGAAMPFILLTGQGNREIDLEAMRAGAADYLDKADLTVERLDRAIRYVIGKPERVARSLSEPAPGPRPLEPAAPEPSGRGEHGEPPRVLLIEDDEDDFILAEDLLNEAFGRSVKLDWVETWDRAMATIQEGGHDICLVDYRLGERTGLELVREAVARGSAMPFILLTGQGNREIDLEAMRAGAADYLVKGEITAPLLDRAIRYAIERHRSERRLAELARFDQLTGLANRVLFRDYLTRRLARADRSQSLVAVMLLDLDRFKVVNDTHGHGAGDLLLQHVANRLNGVVRASDLIARLGGDEFVVVMDEIHDPAVVARFASRILEVIKEPVQLGTVQAYTSASIGIAIYPIDGDSIEEVVASADAAMYRAKEQGADRYHFYTMEMRVRAVERHALEDGLRHAIARDELRLYYQPQIDLVSGAVVGMEALLRWDHPERGLVAPSDFLPIAEESGLIGPIGAWVLETACRQLRDWRDSGAPELCVAVNVSARQLQHEDLEATVASILARYRLDPSCLEIEITESNILKDPVRVAELVGRFGEMGIQVSLDDFGTGYSSLNHLRSFRGATIKIDQSFIRNVCTDANDAAIVRSVIEMAHNLNLKVIAEGVETPEQLDFLRHQRCDAIQGYLISRPLPPERIPPSFLHHRHLPLVADDGEPVG